MVYIIFSVKSMSIALKVKRDTRARESYVRKEGIAIGKAEGKAEAVLELLKELGVVPKSLEETIVNEKDIEVLNKWLKLAAKAESIDAFAKKMMDNTNLN